MKKFLMAFTTALLLGAMLLTGVSPVMADATAATDAGTGANVATVGTVAWATPGNITGAGNATAAITAAAVTNYLQGTNYGFAVPAGATIDGIQVDISRSSTGAATTDTEVKLIRAGAVETTNYAALVTPWPAAFGTATYGGAADLWGAAWSYADINNAGFGVALSATDTGAAIASVDYMQITVTYTLPTPTPATINLGLAGNFAVLAQTAITNASNSTVVGNMGIYPNNWTSITGFAMSMDASNVFAISPFVTGKIYAAAPPMVPPTPANMNTATNDRLTAYTYLNGLAANATELGAGDISGLTFAPGVYYWSTGVNINTDIYLTGSASDVWIFQCGSFLTTASGTNIVLSGGAQASNIYWTVAGLAGATLGTGSTFNGTILSAYAIVMDGGGTFNGRALAASAVNFNGGATNFDASGTAPAPASSSVALVSSSNPSVYGNAVTFTATVTGAAPTGPVQFMDGASPLGLPVLLNGSGVATYTTSALDAGSYNLTAVYAGDLNNAGGTSNLVVQQVNQRPITVKADSKEKIFLNPDPAFTYNIISGSLLPGDSFSGSLTREWGELPGRYDILQGSLSAGGNYDITYREASLTIRMPDSPPPPTGTNPPGTLTPTTTPTTTATTVPPTVPPTTSTAPGTTVITMTNPGPAPTTGPTPSQEYVILPGGTSLPPTSSGGTSGTVMTWWIWVLIAAGGLLLLALLLAATRRRREDKN